MTDGDVSHSSEIELVSRRTGVGLISDFVHYFLFLCCIFIFMLYLPFSFR
jgi:hypothetical protein